MTQTPRQKRQAEARKLEKRLPVKAKRGGETAIADKDLRRIKKLLER